MIIRPASKRRDVIRPAVLHDEGRARSLDDGKLHDLARIPKGLRVYVPWDTADEMRAKSEHRIRRADEQRAAEKKAYWTGARDAKL